ncbi:hypothetical protein [Nitrosopumilus sp. Nsub]|uniref:hypothetical protein n=1 Tax=Nitrosopumilus sp. Nsub TaxID=1776294 RepID=UPI00082D1754|nr:hypothetical protein [Nitrosopumilus sp. Nsub]
MFAGLITALIISISGISSTFAEDKTAAELQDEIGTQILKLKVDNQQLEMVGKDSTIPLIMANERKIDSLFAQLDEVIPKLPIAEISDADMQKMEFAMDRLQEIGLALHKLGVDDSTGILEVEVDIERESKNIDAKIMKIIGSDIPTEITYSVNRASLQGACVGQVVIVINSLVCKIKLGT